MSINRKEIQEIADLAKLRVEPHQIDEIVQSMNDIKVMVDEMNAVTAEGVEPMSHPNDMMQLLRADQVTLGDEQKGLLALSANADDEHFLVPKVIE